MMVVTQERWRLGVLPGVELACAGLTQWLRADPRMVMLWAMPGCQVFELCPSHSGGVSL